VWRWCQTSRYPGLPGKSAITGEHRGWSAIRDDFLARIGPLSGQSFRAELLDIAVGETFVVAFQHATASYQGGASISLAASSCG
jgi:hypothetical protein